MLHGYVSATPFDMPFAGIGAFAIALEKGEEVSVCHLGVPHGFWSGPAKTLPSRVVSAASFTNAAGPCRRSPQARTAPLNTAPGHLNAPVSAFCSPVSGYGRKAYRNCMTIPIPVYVGDHVKRCAVRREHRPAPCNRPARGSAPQTRNCGVRLSRTWSATRSSPQAQWLYHRLQGRCAMRRIRSVWGRPTP